MAVPESESIRIMWAKSVMSARIGSALPETNICGSIQDGAKRAPTE